MSVRDDRTSLMDMLDRVRQLALTRLAEITGSIGVAPCVKEFHLSGISGQLPRISLVSFYVVAHLTLAICI